MEYLERLFCLTAAVPKELSEEYTLTVLHLIPAGETWKPSLTARLTGRYRRYSRCDGKRSYSTPVRHVLSRVSDRQKFYAPIEVDR